MIRHTQHLQLTRQQYESDMKVAIDQQAQAQISGIDAGAGQAIGGYQRGAAQARGGVDQNYGLELGANREIYTRQVDAAGQIRGAGLEAAKLRQAAAVIAAVGRGDLKRSRTKYAHPILIAPLELTNIASLQIFQSAGSVQF